MVLGYRDLNEKKDLYNTTNVAILTGKYSIFNNMVMDKFRDASRGSIELTASSVASQIMEEFGTSNDTGGDGLLLSLDFESFMDVVKSPPIDGKWFCACNYGSLSKKQKDKLMNYIKKPSVYGCLVVNSLDFKEYVELFRNQALKSSGISHLLKLSFPTKQAVEELTTSLFEEEGLKLHPQSLKYFTMRMGAAYDDFSKVIMQTSLKFKEINGGNVIDFVTMKDLMKGVENFVLDDFLFELVKPMKVSDKTGKAKIVKGRKLYRMVDSLESDMGYSKLATSLKYKIKDLIQFKAQIINGNIPVMAKYNLKKVKDRIGDEHPLYKFSDYSFKRYAYLASLTSLKDWYYMYLILSNISVVRGDIECEKAILALIHRQVYSNDRVLNDIGIKDTLKENLVSLNMTPYNFEFKGFADDRYLSILEDR